MRAIILVVLFLIGSLLLMSSLANSLPDQICYPLTSGVYCINSTTFAGVTDDNNYPTSIGFGGRTLSLGRNGLSTLTADLPYNSLQLSCLNITGAASNLCTITPTGSSDYSLLSDAQYNLTNKAGLVNSHTLACQNITGSSSNLCTLVDTNSGGDLTEVIGGLGINITSGSGPVPTILINKTYLDTIYYSISNPNGYITTYIDTNDTTAVNILIARVDSINTTVITHTTNINNLISSNTSTNTRIDTLNTTKLNIADAITTYVNRSLWTTIDNYPSACSAGTFVTAVGDSLTCGTPSGTGVSTVSSNTTNYITVNNASTATVAVNLTGFDARYVLQSGTTGENITSGTVADARIASTITRDTEVPSLETDSISTPKILYLNQTKGGLGSIQCTGTDKLSNVTLTNTSLTATCTTDLNTGSGADGSGGWTNTTTYTQTTLNVNVTGNASLGTGNPVLSTFATGVNISSLIIADVLGCTQALETNSNGTVVCGTDATGTSDGSGGWTNTTTYTQTQSLIVNVTSSDTSTLAIQTSAGARTAQLKFLRGAEADAFTDYIFWSQGGNFGINQSAGGGNRTPLYIADNNGFIGILTQTPNSALTVAGFINTTYLIIANNTAANCDLKADTRGNVYCGTDNGGTDTNDTSRVNSINSTLVTQTARIDTLNSSQLEISTAISTYVNRSLWTTIDNYPSACSAGSYVTQVGDTLTCSVPTGTNNAITLDARNITSGTFPDNIITNSTYYYASPFNYQFKRNGTWAAPVQSTGSYTALALNSQRLTVCPFVVQTTFKFDLLGCPANVANNSIKCWAAIYNDSGSIYPGSLIANATTGFGQVDTNGNVNNATPTGTVCTAGVCTLTPGLYHFGTYFNASGGLARAEGASGSQIPDIYGWAATTTAYTGVWNTTATTKELANPFPTTGPTFQANTNCPIVLMRIRTDI